MASKKVYAVDVHWDWAKCFRVEAESREDAVRQVNEIMERVNSLPTCEIDGLRLGFEATSDFETEVCGEGDTEDTIVYL